jgi:hypothetical protein
MKKNDKDNYLLPLCRQDTKKGKHPKKSKRQVNYSVSSSSSPASSSSSSSSYPAGAREGPMPKVDNSARVNEA